MRFSSVMSWCLVGSCSSLLAQQSRAIFDAPVVAVDAWSRIDELVDLDRDGDLDGVGFFFEAVNSSTQPAFLVLRMHRNDGTGRMTSIDLRSWLSSAGQPTQYRATVGDVDGDGDDDLVTLVGTSVVIVESRPGGPTLREIAVFPAFDYESTLALVRVPSDPRPKLVVGDASSGLRAFSILPTSLAFFGIAPISFARDFVVIDADSDGSPDVAVSDGAAIRFYSVASGALTLLSTTLLPYANYQQLGTTVHPVVGDVDNDGDTDVVLFGDTKYAFIERVGPAQFLPHLVVVGGPATNLADVDGDGDLDGCCCGGGGGPTIPSPNNGAAEFMVAINQGGGVFAPAYAMPAVGGFHLAGVRDMDGDGRSDLVGGRCIYFGRGTTDPLPATPLLALPAAPPTDVDQDGDADLLLGFASRAKNAADGTFTLINPSWPALTPLEAWAGPICELDHDGDGAPDVLVQHHRMSTLTATHLLRNAGGGYFVDLGAIGPAGQPIVSTDPPLLVDLDADNDRDLVAIGQASASSTQVWFRQANGAFVPGPTWPNHRALAATDFTGDGRPDLLVATYPFFPSLSWMDLHLLVNQGNATFALVSTGHTTLALQSLGIVDCDGDGDTDIVAWDYTGVSEIKFLVNDGLGGFTPGQRVFGVTLAPGASIRVADVDADGRYDIVAGPPGHPDFVAASGQGVWVLRQRTAGQFEPVLYTATMGWPTDLDGDGDVDLLGKRTVRNALHSGATAGERQQFGHALAGTQGAVPTLGATGPFRVAAPIAITITGGLGGSVAVLGLSVGRVDLPGVPFPGFTFYLDAPPVLLVLGLGGSAGAPGQGSATLNLNVSPQLAGHQFHLQGFLFDSAAPSSFTQTQGLRLRFGQ